MIFVSWNGGDSCVIICRICFRVSSTLPGIEYGEWLARSYKNCYRGEANVKLFLLPLNIVAKHLRESHKHVTSLTDGSQNRGLVYSRLISLQTLRCDILVRQQLASVYIFPNSERRLFFWVLRVILTWNIYEGRNLGLGREKEGKCLAVWKWSQLNPGGRQRKLRESQPTFHCFALAQCYPRKIRRSQPCVKKNTKTAMPNQLIKATLGL